MVKVGIVGATGYSGRKLAQILAKHRFVDVVYLSSRQEEGKVYNQLFPEVHPYLNLPLKRPSAREVEKKCEVVFLCLPHTASMDFISQLNTSKLKVIDLSADYRLKDASLYKKFYNRKHSDRKNLKKSVYGLPEILRKEIRNTGFVANPGCYAVSIILALYPLLKRKLLKESVVVDAKSGASGAGRKASLELSFCELYSDLRCYGPLMHRHLPEIIQVLKDSTSQNVDLALGTHLVSIHSGIMSTIYGFLKPQVKEKHIIEAYSIYREEPFIKLYYDGRLPSLRDVVGTNFCKIGFKVKGDKLLVVSCIDNLIKGASGNAVQNMNIMLGFKETEALL